MSKKPVLFDLDDDAPAADPAAAPPPPDLAPATRETAMQQAAVMLARKPSVLGRWFWSLLLTLFGLIISISAWNWTAALLVSNPLLGMVVTVTLILFCCTLAAIAIRELIAFARLRRIDEVQRAAARALAEDDLIEARRVIGGLKKLYANRPDAAWGLESLKDHESEILDAGGLLGLAETDLLAPLDAQARREVEAAARQVATVTAVVPLALADVFTALTSNLRMIRRIAEVYGGRSGALETWRLTRSVLAHLVATGAVAVGDDLISSVAGGGVLSKVSRRFGEGVINGALTARVGVAAIEVCRPLPFHAAKRPSVTGLVQRALTGLFGGR